LKRTAGETSISKLSYEEKKDLFGDGEIPNLQGAEYYIGGVFALLPAKKHALRAMLDGSALVGSFDWRQRHGANDPQSPYYDGDPSGSGWITPVRDQGPCGSCWAFGANGSIKV
jgi:hypothetical protein